MAWIERQSPDGDEIFLDHVGWFVADLDAAAARLAELGFAVTEENVHMNRQPDGSAVPSGTVNRLSTLALGYLEFLGARGDTPLARQHGSQLARYEGLHLMAFSSSDVPAEAPRLQGLGFETLEPVDMRRAIDTPEGPGEARFSVLRVPPEVMPEGRVQWCGHWTPEHVWRPDGLANPNGADALLGALWVVDDLEEALDRYGRFLRKPAERMSDGWGRIQMERGFLDFATVAGASSRAPGFQGAPTTPFGAAVWLRSEDLDATERYFASAAIPFDRAGDEIVVGPDQALGAALVFQRG